MEYNKIDNIEISGVDMKDYPDFCDAHISSADYDGSEMTELQLDEISEDRQFVYDQIINQLF